MECTIRKTLGLTAECLKESCPFWDDAADDCFILARFGPELMQPQVAAWANGLRCALDEARVRSGRPE